MPLPFGGDGIESPMSILVDRTSRVLIQGITGREGMARAQLMKDYGTNVVAGVTPGRGGQAVYGIPVYDSVEEAWESQGAIDVSVIFIPAALVKNAALEAIAAGVKLLVIVPDRVPIYDVLDIARAAREKGARFVGPNTLGLLSPGQAVLGMIGGRAQRAREWFKPGAVGVSSRSGGMTSAISYYLTQAGLGQSTIIHVGGDAVVGLSHPEVMELFERDERTEAVAMFGEIGTTQEERVADLVEGRKFTKPLIAYIGGKAAKAGTRFSHAGAIVEGSRGSYETKVKRLREAGVHVVDAIFDIPKKVKELLG
jgi:succinyl-CoA synthetase alpha subunit